MKIYWRTITKHFKKDPDTFPFGIRFYDAVQGGGKTLSMVFDAIQLKKQFPDMILISNVIIKDFSQQYNFDTVDELITLLEFVQNKKHTLVIIDEALTYFAENGGIDPALMNKITQNRKCRRFIMLATQKFKRVNNRLRDFSLETVKCHNLWFFQVNVVRDDTTLIWDKDEMDFIGRKKYTYIFKRNTDLFNRFDTYASIKIDKSLSTNSLLSPGSPPASQKEWVEMLSSIKK